MPKHEEGHPHYKTGRDLKISREQRDFARRRIGGLATFGESHRPSIDLLANAYVLGLKDAIENQEEEESACGNYEI